MKNWAFQLTIGRLALLLALIVTPELPVTVYWICDFLYGFSFLISLVLFLAAGNKKYRGDAFTAWVIVLETFIICVGLFLYIAFSNRDTKNDFRFG